jgi:hypothetical protein
MDLSKSYVNVQCIYLVQMICCEEGSEPLGSINEQELIVPFSNYGLFNVPCN